MINPIFYPFLFLLAAMVPAVLVAAFLAVKDWWQRGR